MGNFLYTYLLPKLNLDWISSLNRPITAHELEVVISSLPTKVSQGLMVLVQILPHFERKINTNILSGYTEWLISNIAQLV